MATADQSDWRSLYPFCTRFETIDGQHMHYLDESPGDATCDGNLVMVHGNPTWSFYWRNLIIGLRGRYRCVVPDHIGCGFSDKPQQYRYCLDQHANNLIELVERLRLRDVTMLGHDWGGAIGLLAATRRPELFRRFVLFNTGAFPPPRVPSRIAICRLPILGAIGLRCLNLFSRAALHMATELPSGLPPAVAEGLLAPYDSWTNRVGVYHFVRDIPLNANHPTHRVLAELEESLRQITDVPVQLIWGMKDWCFDPKCLERFIDIFPQAEVHRLAQAGHWVIEDAHAEIVPIVERFLMRDRLCSQET